MTNLIMMRKAPAAQSGTLLSPRELECVGLTELSNAEIALALGLSVHTIRANLRTASAKLGATNRTEARELAYRLEVKKAA